jgi:serine/threonine protein kinase
MAPETVAARPTSDRNLFSSEEERSSAASSEAEAAQSLENGAGVLPGHGFAADWWAVGVLIVNMVTGEPPFFRGADQGGMPAMFAAILKGSRGLPDLPQDQVSPQALSLVEGLLATDQGARLRAAALIKQHPWFEGLDWQMLEAGNLYPPVAGLPAAQQQNQSSATDAFSDF